MPTNYKALKPKQRKELKAMITEVIDQRKKQIDIIERGYTKPLKDNINYARDVLKGKILVEQFLNHHKQVSARMTKLMGD